MSEVNDFCRACMHKFPNKPKEKECYNIFETRNLATKLTQCSQLRVYPTDEYPHSLCAKCYKMVLDFFEFQRMCKDSAKTFKEILSIGMQEETETHPTIVGDPSAKSTMHPKDCKTDSNEHILSGEYDLDETFNDDQLIEFSINDVMFENGYESENLASPKIEKPLHVKDNAKRTKKENIGHKIKNLRTTELLNSESSNDFNKSLENLPESEYDEFVNSYSEDDELVDSTSNTAQSKLNFQCNLCPELFRFKDRLIAHKRRHQDLGHINNHNVFRREIYKCDINGCGLEYTTKQAINMHLRKQHNFGSALPDSKYICETCGAIMQNADTLQEHQLLHADKTLWPFKCAVDGCFKTFRKAEHYKEHISSHNGTKPYACAHCKKRFCSSYNLSVHVNNHTLEKEWLCSSCAEVAYTPDDLRDNIEKQDEINPTPARTVRCRFCNITLSSYTARQCHEMIHTGEKPYVCKVCGRGFLQSAALKSHKGKHRGDNTKKEFNCQLCERCFDTSVDLKNHVLKHTGENPHECGKCGVKFRYQSNLRRHHREQLCRKVKLPDKDLGKDGYTEVSIVMLK